MNIIFLDIDGVLNHTEFLLQKSGYLSTEEQIDASAVETLNLIVEATEAKIVISSSWRCFLPMDDLTALLVSKGLKAEVIGRTDELWSERGNEIQLWLDENPETRRFVILDDNDDMGKLVHKLVQTSCEKGLQSEHIGQAVDNMYNVRWWGAPK